MAKQATHDGECQLCGRVQKLPAERMAKHGYTVRWGFFSGVCPGSRHLSYERSAALIADRIPTVRQEIETLEAAAVEAEKETDFAWVQETPRKGPLAGYPMRRRLPLSALTLNTYGELRWKGEDGTEHRHYLRYDVRQKRPGLSGAATHLNGERAAEYRAQAARVREYLAWLTERAAKWTLRELRPAARVEPKAPACPKCGGRRSYAFRDGQRRCSSRTKGAWMQCGTVYPDPACAASK